MKLILDGVRPPRPPPEVHFPDEIWTLVQSCWAHQPLDRPSSLHVTEVLRNISDSRVAGPSQPSVLVNDNTPEYDPESVVLRAKHWVEREQNA
jgi:hypothetical protein